jgi:hypothetical protein
LYFIGALVIGNKFHAAVTALDRPIFDQQLKSFCFIKLYIKFKPFDLKSTVMIIYRVELRHYITVANPGLW